MALPCGHRVVAGIRSAEAVAAFDSGECPGCGVPLREGASLSGVRFQACPCCGTKWTKHDDVLASFEVF